MGRVKKILDGITNAVGGIALVAFIWLAAQNYEKTANAPDETIKNARVVSVKKWIDMRYLPKIKTGLFDSIRESNIRSIENREGSYDYGRDIGFTPEYVEYTNQHSLEGYIAKEEVVLENMPGAPIVFVKIPRQLTRLEEGDVADFVVRKKWYSQSLGIKSYDGIRVENLHRER
jgi:hypothetical protein